MEQQATITGLTLLGTVILSAMTLVIPRKYVLLPFVLGACWVPADQTIMVGELNFQVLRVLVVMGLLRLWIRGEIIPVRWNRFDKLILAWAIVGTIVYVLQWMTFSSLIYKCGRMLEWLGLYWIFRQTVRSWDDLRFACVALAVCAIAMAPFVFVEWTTLSNPFSILGRVAVDVRDGTYRCAATFPHSIMMGLFWATLVPLFVGFARRRQHPLLFWTAVGASTFMIMVTASSTPVLTLLVGGALLLAYRRRSSTGTAAWVTLGLLFALHIVMKAPVWHLVARVGVISGSTGWHRFHLIDQAIRHFTEWMLLGTRSTGHWGWGLQDITNQYILEGVRGGLVTLVLFCAILFAGARAVVRLSLHSQEKDERYLAWCVFVTILAHCASFVGVSYFGQITMIWYLLLATVGLCYGKVQEKPKHPRTVVVAPEQSLTNV